jgi:type VI protein secretion system component VasF
MPKNNLPRRIPEMPKDPYYAFDESWTPLSGGTDAPPRRKRRVRIPYWVYIAVAAIVFALLVFWLRTN